MVERLDPHHVDLRVGIGLEDDVVGRLDLALLTTSISSTSIVRIRRSSGCPRTESPAFPGPWDFWGSGGAGRRG